MGVTSDSEEETPWAVVYDGIHSDGNLASTCIGPFYWACDLHGSCAREKI